MYRRGDDLWPAAGGWGAEVRPCLAALILAASAGCMNTAVLEAFKGYRNTIGGEWLKYTDENPNLTERDKRARRLLHEAAGRVIEEAGGD